MQFDSQFLNRALGCFSADRSLLPRAQLVPSSNEQKSQGGAASPAFLFALRSVLLAVIFQGAQANSHVSCVAASGRLTQLVLVERCAARTCGWLPCGLHLPRVVPKP
jgi:hypothetical protein